MLPDAYLAIFSKQFVQDHAARGGDVQRVFETQHGDADVRIGKGREFGANAIDFVAEHNADGETWRPIEEVDCVDGGFDCREFVAARTQGFE